MCISIDKQTHWDQIYATKASEEVSWYQQEPTISLQLIEEAHLPLDARFIDVGGGASVLIDYVLDFGFQNPAVLDISVNALSQAQHRLADRAQEVAWVVSDVTEFASPYSFDLWHDRAVFHFLTEEEDRRRYVTVLKQATEPGAHIIIATFAVGGPEKCSGLSIVQYDAEKISGTLGPHFALQQTRNEVHRTPSGAKQLFTYFLFQRM